MNAEHSPAPSAGTDRPSAGDSARREFTIDELAREAGTTVRNVRAYQDRGLIEPPERRGRVGIYGEQQLSRLRLIDQLLNRGYTLASIQELFAALENGHDLHQILGLERAIASPWTAERPRNFSAEELRELFSGPLQPELIARIFELDLLRLEDDHFHAPNPNILLAGAELAKAGLRFEDMLTLVDRLRENVERVTEEVVRLIVEMLDRYDDKLPPAEDVPKLAELLWRLRPLTMMAIESEVSRALERSANKFLGDRIARVLDHLPKQPAAPRQAG